MINSDNSKALPISDINLSMNFAQISNSLNNTKDDIEQNLKYITLFENIFLDYAKRQKACLEKMIAISDLPDNWNDNGAKKFGHKLIVKCYSILFGLPVLPEIFPVADGSIQFEYEMDDGLYLEFNIFENEVYEFIAYTYGKKIERGIERINIREEVI